MLLINWGYIWRCPIVLLVILVSLSGLVFSLIILNSPYNNDFNSKITVLLKIKN